MFSPEVGGYGRSTVLWCTVHHGYRTLKASLDSAVETILTVTLPPAAGNDVSGGSIFRDISAMDYGREGGGIRYLRNGGEMRERYLEATTGRQREG